MRRARGPDSSPMAFRMRCAAAVRSCEPELVHGLLDRATTLPEAEEGGAQSGVDCTHGIAGAWREERRGEETQKNGRVSAVERRRAVFSGVMLRRGCSIAGDATTMMKLFLLQNALSFVNGDEGLRNSVDCHCEKTRARQTRRSDTTSCELVASPVISTGAGAVTEMVEQLVVPHDDLPPLQLRDELDGGVAVAAGAEVLHHPERRARRRAHQAYAMARRSLSYISACAFTSSSMSWSTNRVSDTYPAALFSSCCCRTFSCASRLSSLGVHLAADAASALDSLPAMASSRGHFVEHKAGFLGAAQLAEQGG
ncbi:hypothetical protein ZIOFF_016887 [Zingiber officinale]|uniref:Uncharacterized protein n=1 Tax=Zingiber officinale TaxID=94328 RepID=A0A8J5H6G5_ZINOF|nr:hypothetical protein ZIOFF_016887 [Zingiber officinale]